MDDNTVNQRTKEHWHGKLNHRNSIAIIDKVWVHYIGNKNSIKSNDNEYLIKKYVPCKAS